MTGSTSFEGAPGSVELRDLAEHAFRVGQVERRLDAVCDHRTEREAKLTDPRGVGSSRVVGWSIRVGSASPGNGPSFLVRRLLQEYNDVLRAWRKKEEAIRGRKDITGR